MTIDLDRFGQDVASAPTMADAYVTLSRLTDQVIGIKLFTVMTFDRSRGEARRVYSNMPGEYPVSGTKPVEENVWTRHVLDGRNIFVANTIDEIAEVFPDFELIRSLGCESCINIPIEVGGEVLGTLNCLHEGAHYTRERVVAAEALKLPGAVCLLMEKTASKKEASNG